MRLRFIRSTMKYERSFLFNYSAESEIMIILCGKGGKESLTIHITIQALLWTELLKEQVNSSSKSKQYTRTTGALRKRLGYSSSFIPTLTQREERYVFFSSFSISYQKLNERMENLYISMKRTEMFYLV